MTVAGFVVTLAEGLHEDGVDGAVNALRHIRGVVDVQPVEDDVATMMARIRVDQEWRERLIKLMRSASRNG